MGMRRSRAEEAGFEVSKVGRVHEAKTPEAAQRWTDGYLTVSEERRKLKLYAAPDDDSGAEVAVRGRVLDELFVNDTNNIEEDIEFENYLDRSKTNGTRELAHCPNPFEIALQVGIMRGVKKIRRAQGMLMAVEAGEISLADAERMVRIIERDGARRGANFAPGSKDAWLAALTGIMPGVEQGVSSPDKLVSMQLAQKLIGYGRCAHDLISSAVAKTMQTVFGILIRRELDWGTRIPRRLVAPASALLRAFFAQLEDVDAARRLFNECNDFPNCRADNHPIPATLLSPERSLAVDLIARRGPREGASGEAEAVGVFTVPPLPASPGLSRGWGSEP
ncbi:Hypothetical Protein FCC1311_099902 [Hondaea fermentalgiana]|uniref:Uncharacterized protein n=1 Tax=Hondaea fermentalgiana TaxID=2315210 RepID=A0A2R5GSA9_9STRA|nr:Hypothetical Protein FCC1311_099902 [Hondaea fermentalgiana]|eukprot:GBG33767.1 Hypothetical Protein FCC1311_099902 [Hondaea fermentalgiana]